MHGKRFFAEEFGVECEGVWLPDSFGYTAAYPQLARLAGMRWFLTQKISWNQTNKLPHHTFWWEGIDGTRIFTHFPPVDTYNAVFSGEELAHAVRNYADKGGGTRSLLPFGHGDGGGGPTREMMETRPPAARPGGLAPGRRRGPRTRSSARPQAEYPDAPVWSGELYLELHRATYTSQARTKAGNRRSEHLLREAELWAATAAVQAGVRLPVRASWTGCGRRCCCTSSTTSCRAARSPGCTARPRRRTPGGGELEAIIAAGGPGRWPATGDRAVGAQRRPPGPRRGGGRRRRHLGPRGRCPRTLRSLLDVARSEPPADPVTRRPTPWLDNGLVRVELDDDGLLTSVRDLAADREVLAPGARGNLLQLHTDLPNDWDAWDIDQHYRRQYTDLTDADSITVGRARPAGRGDPRRAVVRRLPDHPDHPADAPAAGGSTSTPRSTGTRRRRSSRRPSRWTCTPTAPPRRSSSGTSSGPTHTNTSWDAARFEVYCHRWIARRRARLRRRGAQRLDLRP